MNLIAQLVTPSLVACNFIGLYLFAFTENGEVFCSCTCQDPAAAIHGCHKRFLCNDCLSEFTNLLASYVMSAIFNLYF